MNLSKFLTKKGYPNPNIVRSDVYKELLEKTSFLPPNSSISERIYCLRFNITQCIVCVCGKQTKYYGTKGYAKFCSTKCANGDTFVQEKQKNVKIKKYGSSNNSKKMKITCNEKYGTSSVLHKDCTVRKSIEFDLISKYGSRGINGFTKNTQDCLKIVDMNGSEIGLRKLCSMNEVSYNWANKIYKKFGNQGVLDWIYQKKSAFNLSSNLESFISENLSLTKQSNIVKSVLNDSHKRPDFKLNETTFLDVDGLYWHSEKYKDREYHYDKRQWYENNGLRLYQLREDEISYKFDIIKSMLGFYLDRSNYAKIRASSCEIRNISQPEASKFLDKNHLQGSGSSAKHFGLYYGNELVSCMSIRKNFKGHYEISRFCVKIDCVVYGGFSKTLQFVLELLNIHELYSWCDLRYANGDVYIKNGFHPVKETLGWCWTDFKYTYHRLNFTETQAENLGLVKIYDAGQRLYKLTLIKEK